MIFGTPVSGFEKKSEEIIWKKVLAVQQYAEFGLEESCGGGETACRAKSERHMPGRVAAPHDRRSSRMVSTALPFLEAGRLMRGSASLKFDASRCPLSLDSPVVSAR